LLSMQLVILILLTRAMQRFGRYHPDLRIGSFVIQIEQRELVAHAVFYWLV